MNYIPLYFFSAVWGKAFVRQYLDAVLPTLLSPGNFGASLAHPADRYFIYTTLEDSEVIKANPSFQVLKSLIRTEINIIDSSQTQKDGEALLCWDANRLVNRLYAQVIPLSIEARAAMMMLTPDQPWSDGSFKSIRRILESGKRAVSLNCMMIKAKTLIPELRQKYYSNQNHTISISSREFVELALKHPHEYQSCYQVKSPYYAKYAPSTYCWDVPGEGSLMYIIGGDAKAIIHKDPSIAWPEAPGFEVLEHVYSLGINDEDFYWAQESDELFSIALDSRAFGDKDFLLEAGNLNEPISPIYCAWWLRKNIPQIKRRLLSMPMRMNYKDRSQTWAAVEKEATRFMSEIFDLIEFLDRHPTMAHDLDLQMAELDNYRAEHKEFAEFQLRAIEATIATTDQFKTHRKLAHHCGIQGNIDSALRHVQTMLSHNLESTIKAVNETATILHMASRTEHALQLLHGCEALLKARSHLPN